MSAYGLTPKQSDLLAFIARRLDHTNVPPSFDEMRIAMVLQSKSGIFRMVDALERRGYIRRFAKHARSIALCDAGRAQYSTEPVNCCPHCGNPLGSMACRIAARAGIETPISNAEQRAQ